MLNGKITERVALGGMPIVRMNVGGQRLFLSPKFGDIDVEATSGKARWGVYQLAFLVDDIDVAVEELKARGAQAQNIKAVRYVNRVLFRSRQCTNRADAALLACTAEMLIVDASLQRRSSDRIRNDQLSE